MSVIVDVAAARGRTPGGSDASAAVERWRRRVDGRLETLIDSGDEACPRLLETMRYSLLSPGKRVGRGELWAGVPAKHRRELTAEELEDMAGTAGRYVGYAQAHVRSLGDLEAD